MRHIAGPVFCRKYGEILTTRPMKVWQIEAMLLELNAGVDQADGLLDGGNQEVPI